jgi:hypothetical protein
MLNQALLCASNKYTIASTNTYTQMLLKRHLLIALLCFIGFTATAQSSYQINLRVSDRRATIDAIEIDNTLLFLNHGSTNVRVNGDNDAELDYYGKFDRDELFGKTNLVGSLHITYYDSFDRGELIGKIKSIGDIKFTYYDYFDRTELMGKIKSIGGIQLKYYDFFDRSELMGKLKSIGDIKVTYYDWFGPSWKMGRVKSVKGETPQVQIIVANNISADVEISK